MIENPAFVAIQKRATFAHALEPFMDDAMRAAFDPNNFFFADKYIKEFTAGDGPFSIALLNAMFPKWAADPLYH
jgi:hypothetical protein